MEMKEENRIRRITLRFKPIEYKLVEGRFKKTVFLTMSEYSRSVLLGKNITVIHRDKSMDDVLEELILLRKEINSIGNNFNQAVKKLNSVSGMPEAHIWQSVLTVLRDQLEPSIREIKERMNSYSDIWSQRLSAEKV